MIKRTRGFIRNIQANLVKRDWYNVPFIKTLGLFFALGLTYYLGVGNINTENVEQNVAQVISQTKPVIAEKPRELKIGTYFLTKNLDTRTSSTTVVFDSEKENSKEYTSYFPNVFFDGTEKNVMFLNSQKKLVTSINTKSLKLETLLGEDGMDFGTEMDNGPYISSLVLENPTGVFYFSATNFYACGASNCTYVLYRYNIDTKKLDVLGTDLFGNVMGLYLSPDSKYLLWVAGSSGGYCLGSLSAGVVNIQTLEKIAINDPFNESYSDSYIQNIEWKNNHTAHFVVQYMDDEDCHNARSIEIEWIYDADTTFITKLKSTPIQGSVGG